MEKNSGDAFQFAFLLCRCRHLVCAVPLGERDPVLALRCIGADGFGFPALPGGNHGSPWAVGGLLSRHGPESNLCVFGESSRQPSGYLGFRIAGFYFVAISSSSLSAVQCADPADLGRQLSPPPLCALRSWRGVLVSLPKTR